MPELLSVAGITLYGNLPRLVQNRTWSLTSCAGQGYFAATPEEQYHGSSLLQTELERHAGTFLLRLKGDMRLWGKPDRGGNSVKAFRSVLEDPPGRLVLSLTGVDHLDTLGISSLVKILIDCSKHEIELRLVMATGLAGEAVRRVHIFEPSLVFPDEQSALQEGA